MLNAIVEPAACPASCASSALLVAQRVVLDNYLRHAPLAHALFRTCERQELQSVELRRPVLDLGCGRGEFANWALHGPLDLGVDISPKQAARARRRGAYQTLVVADAGQLPLADESFQTVLAVSSLEHMRRQQRIMSEAARVLRSGGILAATIVLREFTEMLFWPALARRLRLSPLGTLYRRVQDRLFRHITMLGQDDWEQLVQKAGLEIVISRRFFSPAAVRRYDMLLPLALPYRLLGPLGIPTIIHTRWRRRLAERLLKQMLEPESPGPANDDSESAKAGGLLFLVARKPAPWNSQTLQGVS
jgi:SAM-dependent methyltransferase